MNNDDFISVGAFAKTLGISNQAVYQQLDKKLKPYLKIVDNKKMLSVKALSEIYGKGVKQEIDKGFNNFYQEEVNFLKKQLETLTEQLDKEREHNRELNNKLVSALNNLSATPLLEQQNQLAEKIQEHTKHRNFFERFKYLIKGEFENE